MKNERLLEIINNLKVCIRDLEAEINSQNENHLLNIPYEDVVAYYETDDTEEVL